MTCTPTTCPASVPALHHQRPTHFPVGQFEDVFLFNCEAGFAPTKREPFTCTSEGRWSGGSLNCHRLSKTCAAVAVLIGVHAVGVADGGRCPEGHIGEQCTLNCVDGYTASATAKPFTCSAAGKWTGGSVTCKAIPQACKAEPPTPHAKPCPLGLYDPLTPTRCTSACETGYYNRGTGNGDFICGHDLRWVCVHDQNSGQNDCVGGLDCVPNECPAESLAQGAEPCPVGQFDLTNPSTCIPQCADGYFFSVKPPSPSPEPLQDIVHSAT